ncbi:class II fumarate hydratase [bacterium]|nr:class II fumarate hydratase [bacterium]
MTRGGETRTEHDSLGAVEVPADAYWGAQTERARANFPRGDDRFPDALVHAFGAVKLACARANAAVDVLPASLAALVEEAAGEVARGGLDGAIVVPVWHSGSGTQLNMNVNEVIAGRANELAGRGRGGREPVHPNDHVNRSQSSNDVVPTALHVAAIASTEQRLLPALAALIETLDERRAAIGDVETVGRTHLMDALPITLGHQLTAWRELATGARAHIEASLEPLRTVPLGGAAVGTGAGTPDGFKDRAIGELAAVIERELMPAALPLGRQAAHAAPLGLSGALRDLATGLHTIAEDVRLLGSGPRCGLGELILPANEPGSSAMPGKVNPTQCEAMVMIALQVMANDQACALAARAGHLQLNTARPLLAVNLLRSIDLLAEGVASFDARCLAGLDVDRERTRELRERSLMLVTALVPRLGYDRAAAIAARAHREGITLREAVLAEGALEAGEFDALIAALTSGTP